MNRAPLLHCFAARGGESFSRRPRRSAPCNQSTQTQREQHRRFAVRGQTALLAAIFLSMIYPVSAGSLDAYRWKNRLIVVFLPGGESRDEFAASLASNHAEIDERDLIIIDVSPGAARIPHTLRLDPQHTKALREQLKLSSSESKATFILIGKDGGEKARQLGTLNLVSWFALIDEMPMRREEIRHQRKSQE
jgi:hypothetical protein